jgi:hypothetical protein
MEIRKIYDLKTINRLLVNASTLDVKDDKELMALIDKGELIPLSDLVTKSENQGFSPPKTLAMMHPGAENYVYNAPRYYPLGENFIDQMIAIFDRPSSSHDIMIVQQELNVLNRFPHLLLYTSKGIEHAMQAQKALMMLAPSEKFILAYTQVTNKGKIANTHILLDEFADAQKDLVMDDEIAFTDVQKRKTHGSIAGDLAAGVNREGNTDEGKQHESSGNMSNPFLLQLNALVSSRTLTLKPISDEIEGLIATHTQNWNPQFASLYAKAQEKYAKVDEEQKEKIIKAMGTLVQEHKHLPAERFVQYVTEAKATPYFQGYLESIKAQEGALEETKKVIVKTFREIAASISWTSLEESVTKTSDMLNFSMVPDDTMLIQYQNELSSRVIQKLNQLLLSSDLSLTPESFTSETHETLVRILQAAWIEDPETQQFYLSEFDMHQRK